jgi:plastocyanin
VVRRRDKGRRVWFGLAVAIAAALFVTGVALAASQTITGTGSNIYTGGNGASFPTYTTDQGEVVQFNVTGSGHNVTARQNGPDGNALFRTPTISGGTVGVNGTQFLGAGDYTFFCTVHPSTMQATLHVSGNGTPQARPSATLALRTKTISKALKKGLLVAINASAKIDGVGLVAKLGKTAIGQSNGVSLAAGQQVDVVKLSKAGKTKLRGRSTAKVSVTAAIPFGSPASAKGKLK